MSTTGGRSASAENGTAIGEAEDHGNTSANESRHQQILQRNTRHHKSPFLAVSWAPSSKGSKSYFSLSHLLAHLAAVPMPPLAHGNGNACMKVYEKEKRADRSRRTFDIAKSVTGTRCSSGLWSRLDPSDQV